MFFVLCRFGLSFFIQPLLCSPTHTLVTLCATCFALGLTFDSQLSVTPAVPEDEGLVQCVKVPGHLGPHLLLLHVDPVHDLRIVIPGQWLSLFLARYFILV